MNKEIKIKPRLLNNQDIADFITYLFSLGDRQINVNKVIKKAENDKYKYIVYFDVMESDEEQQFDFTLPKNATNVDLDSALEILLKEIKENGIGKYL